MLYLKQTLERAVNGYWDGGKKNTFYWSVDRSFSDGKSKVGSWEANYYFEVKTGNTEKQTLGNARRKLKQSTNIACTFEYVEE